MFNVNQLTLDSVERDAVNANLASFLGPFGVCYQYLQSEIFHEFRTVSDKRCRGLRTESMLYYQLASQCKKEEKLCIICKCTCNHIIAKHQRRDSPRTFQLKNGKDEMAMAVTYEMRLQWTSKRKLNKSLPPWTSAIETYLGVQNVAENVWITERCFVFNGLFLLKWQEEHRMHKLGVEVQF